MNKKIIFIIIILGIVVFSVYRGVFKEKEPEYILIEVVRGNVAREVSETGQVKMGGSINLGFKNAGTIAAIMILEIAQTNPSFYFTATVAPWMIVFALVFSLLVGCLAGFFPAKQAAKLKPVDALRRYE